MVVTGRYETIPVDEIELDRSNPRIRKFLDMYGDNPTSEQIFLALGAGNDDESDRQDGPTFQKLKQSIITNGGIIQPIILNRRADGTLVCIEGNTRVALYTDFLKSGMSGSWSTIPALVHNQIDDAAVHAIRLQVHLVGPRPWDPYSKAKYLHELRHKEHLPFSRIVDFCGGRQTEVSTLIDAYVDMETYYRPIISDDGDFDTTRFSAHPLASHAGAIPGERRRTSLPQDRGKRPVCARRPAGMGVDDAPGRDSRRVDPYPRSGEPTALRGARFPLRRRRTRCAGAGPGGDRPRGQVADSCRQAPVSHSDLAPFSGHGHGVASLGPSGRSIHALSGLETLI